MIGMSLAALLAKHRCARAAVAPLWLAGGDCTLCIKEQLTKRAADRSPVGAVFPL